MTDTTRPNTLSSMSTDAPVAAEATSTPVWSPETTLVHAGSMRSQFAETSEALFLTQGYLYPDAETAEARFESEAGGFIYSRYANPTVAMFEQRMAAFEGADAARATASGMAAVNAALMSYLSAGDHVVSARALFGSCRYILGKQAERFGIETTFVDGRDLDAWAAAMRPNTKVVFFETPSNPTLELIDIAAVCRIAHAQGAIVIIDNVFATPLLQRPLALGADVVVYSATKHIDGQGRCLGGIVLGTRDYIETYVHPFIKHTGPSLSPFNAWVLLKGLETLSVRVRAQCAAAAEIAATLTRAKAAGVGLSRVLYSGAADHPQAAIAAKQMTGGGQVISFEFSSGKAAAFRFINALKLIRISNNLGDTRTLITHPATTTHQRLSQAERDALSITDRLVRLSVGLEAPVDLIADIEQALVVSEAKSCSTERV